MLFCISAVFSQTRKTASGVNGTFRLYHQQKFKKFYNEVKISSLGKGKLRVGFDVVYPKLDLTGLPIISSKREIEGIAVIKGDTAIFNSEDFISCSIIIKFIGQGMIAVLQESEPTDCGFGRKDVTTGNYRKISSVKPKFKEALMPKKIESSTLQ